MNEGAKELRQVGRKENRKGWKEGQERRVGERGKEGGTRRGKPEK